MLSPTPGNGRPANRTAGLLITSVTPGGPAAEAGFQPGDRILRLDGQPITELEALSRAVEEAPVGREFRISIDRGGQAAGADRQDQAAAGASAGGPPVGSARPPRGSHPAGGLATPLRGAGPDPPARAAGGPVIRSEGPDEEPAPSAEPEPPRPSGKPRTAPRPAAGLPARSPRRHRD